LVEKQRVVKEARLAMDTYNRYSIAVRGTSADEYGILHKANIEIAFATLLYNHPLRKIKQFSTCGPSSANLVILPGCPNMLWEKAKNTGWM
jgi:hypothetical protein